MGVLTNYPIALAPAMGHNFFFAYTICIGMGISWQVALGANFISGCIFLLLCLFPFARYFVDMVSDSLKNSIAVGIGLFIAFIGLQWAEIVVAQEGTIVGLGDFTKDYTIFATIGFVITSILIVLKIKGAILIGIISTAIIGIPLGLVEYNGVLSCPPSILPIFMELEPLKAISRDFVIIIFVFFFLDHFDTVGTLIGVSKQSNLMQDNKLTRTRKALFSDALGTIFGTTLGTSTVTSYIESSAGIVAGARTGLVAIVTGFLFLISIFLSFN